MSFQLEPQHRNVPDAELLADIRRVAAEVGNGRLTWAAYSRAGSFGAETIRKRFGSWNAAIESAGLSVNKRWRVPNVELLENLGELWTRLGRQPRRDDLCRVGSRFSSSAYEQRFRGWRRALEAFVAFANANEPAAPPEFAAPGSPGASTPRQPSLRLRFKVMRRDRFHCSQCGASPSRDPGVELHIDHIVPWSRGGHTELENLTTLCAKCNLGKSDLGAHEG
jgi:hypothetical protein